MFDVLRFKADAPVTRISAALARTPARRVAVVFPLGAHVAIADLATLTALAARARNARKTVTIVGGDAYLRACAVTVGFAAATSVEEWRVAKEERARNAGAITPALTLLDPASGGLAARGERAEDSVEWELDPPAYLARLLPTAEHEERDEHECVVGETTSGKLRTLPPPSDAAAYRAAISASERYEEEISDTIRETSGFDLEDWVPPTSRAAGESDFGEARHP